MNILVASDTHGRAERLAEAVARTKAGVLLFLGDGLRDLARLDLSGIVVRAVRGNCDFFGAEDMPETRVERFGDHTVFLTHGHRFGVKYSPEPAIAAAAGAGADVLLYGHTHVPYTATLPGGYAVGGVTLAKPLTVLCPGSLGDPREGAPAFGTLELRGNGILAAIGRL